MEWDLENPNVLTTALVDGSVVEMRVTMRSQEEGGLAGTISEFSRVSLALFGGAPTLQAQRTRSFGWEREAVWRGWSC